MAPGLGGEDQGYFAYLNKGPPPRANEGEAPTFYIAFPSCCVTMRPMSLNGKLASAIVMFPDPVLASRAQPVCDADLASWEHNIAPLGNSMIGLMLAQGGVGLAAPQVGIARRLIVAKVAGENMILANPELSPVGTDTNYDTEGCLSIPGLQALVERLTHIKVTGVSDKGKVEFDLSGFDARVMQHEVDHLDGILFPQRLCKEDQIRLISHINELRGRKPRG